MVKFCKTAYLADFLKTRLTKFAVINHSNEGKGKEKKKERGVKVRRRREKSNGCTLSFYNSYFGDSYWPKKTVRLKGPFGDNVTKNPAEGPFKLNASTVSVP